MSKLSNTDQKLLASVKSFCSVVPEPGSRQGCGAAHSAGEKRATIQMVRETMR